MSLVQHFADAFLPVAGSAELKPCEHFAARSGTPRMLVVVCRSHCECRHTSSLSLVKVTSHSITPAPMRAAAMYDSFECSGNISAAPRWPMEKSVLRKGPVHCASCV